jgi:hypothetical protein
MTSVKSAGTLRCRPVWKNSVLASALVFALAAVTTCCQRLRNGAPSVPNGRRGGDRPRLRARPAALTGAAHPDVQALVSTPDFAADGSAVSLRPEMNRFGSLGWYWGALLWLLPMSVQAADIRWSGASGCRRESEVAEQVETMTKRRLTEVDAADFELILQPVSDGTLRLSLVTAPRHGGAPSTRSLEGASCADVTDAAAVAIALTIGSPEDPTTTTEPPPLPPSAVRPTHQPPAGRDSVTPPVARPSALAWLVGVNGALDSSVTPHAVPGGALRFALTAARFRVELEGAVFAPARVLDAQQRGGRFQLAYAAPLACLVRSFGTRAGLACLGYELGELSADGEGIATSHHRSTFWHALRAEAGLSWPLVGGLSASGRLGGALALARHAFVLDDPQAVHRPALFSVRAALGLELSL